MQVFSDEFIQLMNEAMDKIAEALNQFADSMMDGFYQAYLNAGAPYGETDEGFLQWLEELNNEPD